MNKELRDILEHVRNWSCPYGKCTREILEGGIDTCLDCFGEQINSITHKCPKLSDEACEPYMSHSGPQPREAEFIPLVSFVEGDSVETWGVELSPLIDNPRLLTEEEFESCDGDIEDMLIMQDKKTASFTQPKPPTAEEQ